ncbi:MAG: hypothetical protein K6T83_17920 [Alicyclobacillus sp.]|nr:hypothetical protein [Alicyclobacillus sp.]
MAKEKLYRWYRIEGISSAESTRMERPFRFVYYIESESKKHVLRRFGGERHVVGPDGSRMKAIFPRVEAMVRAMPAHWQPDERELESATDLVTAVIPVTRYTCVCGRVHFSEYPYPSMWCKCGQKAFPDTKGIREAKIQSPQSWPASDMNIHKS